MKCTVVNVKFERCDVRIQRGTKWGNLCSDPGLSRAEKINRYEAQLKEQIASGFITLDDLQSLRGKKLGCGCKPLPCHGDILADFINRMFKDAPSVDDFI